MRRAERAWFLVPVLLALAMAWVPASFAAFSAQTPNPGNVVTAAGDFRAPAVSAVAVAKAAGGTAGFLAPGGSYFVYANVEADTGNPASGLAGASADASALTAGAGSVPLVAGSYTAGGVSYGYRSAELVAGAVAEGSRSVAVTALDRAGNSASLAGSAFVDATAPAASDVQAANAGTVSLMEQGDGLVLTFSEPIEPQSVLAGWTGAATPVVVRVSDNGILGLPGGNDSLQVFNAANSAVLPLGTVDLGRGDYAAGLLGGSFRFGATGTASTMTISGSTIVLAFGTYNSTIVVDAGRTTAGGAGTLKWTPVAGPYDRAGNAISTAAASESGAGDRDF